MWSVTYDRNHSFIVLATVNTIVNYECKTFIVQATVDFSENVTNYFQEEEPKISKLLNLP